jgi:hypothetical protein
MYTNSYGERLLDEVKMLLFVMGVGIVNPNMPFHDEYKQRIQTLFEAGVEVAACVSIAGAIGLEKEVEKPESNSSTPPSMPKSTPARATR